VPIGEVPEGRPSAYVTRGDLLLTERGVDEHGARCPLDYSPRVEAVIALGGGYIPGEWLKERSLPMAMGDDDDALPCFCAD